MSEAQLEQEVRALLHRPELLDAQEDRCYGKRNSGNGQPKEPQPRQDRLEKIRQARKEMEAATTAAAARQRQQEAERAAAQAESARKRANEAAEHAGLEAPDLEPLAADAMPRRGLARKAEGEPTKKTQVEFHGSGQPSDAVRRALCPDMRMPEPA